jgi:hypothetical protein
MKIKPEHLEQLRTFVAPHDTPKARDGAIRRGDSDMRYRWDCLWAAKQSQWVCATLYPYLNDVNIDYALRRIIPKLHRSTTNQGA